MNLALSILLISTMAFAEEMTVKTEKGTVRGIRVDHDFGQYYYSFRGIRYAQAPTGKLRFKVCMYIKTDLTDCRSIEGYRVIENIDMKNNSILFEKMPHLF